MFVGQSKARSDKSIDNRLVKIRLISRDEESRWNALMSEHHYLGYKMFVGERLKYVATFLEEWVALLGFSSPALKNIHRDKWIGWTKELQFKRLNYITNNSRFLILPWIQKKNLASRILSLTLKRLSSDWQRAHGHPVLIVETFVDASKFEGTCYKAAGWKKLGLTKGFGMKNGKYVHHGVKKKIFVRSLNRFSCEALAGEAPSPLLTTRRSIRIMKVDVNKIGKDKLNELRNMLTQIKDPRNRQGRRHSLSYLLMVSACSILSGCHSFRAMGEWAEDLPQDLLKRLGAKFNFKKGKFAAPNEISLRRLMQSIDSDELDKIISTWLAQFAKSKGISIDGKRLRGASHDKDKTVHILSTASHQDGLVLGQKQVSDKSNEIPFFLSC